MSEIDRPINFIEEIVREDLVKGKNEGRLVTRFPPEPNGYLHIGHAKAICLNFGLAQQLKGQCNLRLDDTNPSKEETEYVESIKTDVQWLGFDWGNGLYFASDYFDRLYEMAISLIKVGRAYVDSLSAEEIREYRGDFHRPGRPSPYRERSVEENVSLFERMRSGEFTEGEHVLRAKIDMTSPNLNFRDPPIYRILHAHHHRTGDQWCIYPMYDYAHGLSDAIEGVTHSICTLEFEDHRPLYDWFLQALDYEDNHRPHQYEFARLNLTYTVMSKRKLQRLVLNQHVEGWDDPRMPTIAGLRRRGYPAASLRNFCERIGVTKNNGVVDVGHLEHAVREVLNQNSPRMMAVLKPLKVVITNFPENHIETFDAPLYPNNEDFGSRNLYLTREIYIEQDDFMEDAPKKWFRLSLGKEVRLRYACLLTCEEVIKNDQGDIVELRCTWDPNSKGGTPADGRKVKGTLHWVSAFKGVSTEVKLYDRLFDVINPGKGKEDFIDDLNSNSLDVLPNAVLEPHLLNVKPGETVQFERLGYFTADAATSTEGHPRFHRTITLKDSWAKFAKK
jgi:glutaminyl-tRNA synthetase